MAAHPHGKISSFPSGGQVRKSEIRQITVKDSGHRQRMRRSKRIHRELFFDPKHAHVSRLIPTCHFYIQKLKAGEFVLRHEHQRRRNGLRVRRNRLCHQPGSIRRRLFLPKDLYRRMEPRSIPSVNGEKKEGSEHTQKSDDVQSFFHGITYPLCHMPPREKLLILP